MPCRQRRYRRRSENPSRPSPGSHRSQPWHPRSPPHRPRRRRRRQDQCPRVERSATTARSPTAPTPGRGPFAPNVRQRVLNHALPCCEDTTQKSGPALLTVITSRNRTAVVLGAIFDSRHRNAGSGEWGHSYLGATRKTLIASSVTLPLWPEDNPGVGIGDREMAIDPHDRPWQPNTPCHTRTHYVLLGLLCCSLGPAQLPLRFLPSRALRVRPGQSKPDLHRSQYLQPF
jgi:hypothetical protein